MQQEVGATGASCENRSLLHAGAAGETVRPGVGGAGLSAASSEQPEGDRRQSVWFMHVLALPRPDCAIGGRSLDFSESAHGVTSAFDK